jgi:hypothetical protein
MCANPICNDQNTSLLISSPLDMVITTEGQTILKNWHHKDSVKSTGRVEGCLVFTEVFDTVLYSRIDDRTVEKEDTCERS